MCIYFFLKLQCNTIHVLFIHFQVYTSRLLQIPSQQKQWCVYLWVACGVNLGYTHTLWMLGHKYTLVCIDLNYMPTFELWCWRRLLRVPWTARRSNQSILKEISPECSLEGLMLKLETPVLWPPDVKSWHIGKDPDAGKDWRWEEKGMTEVEMVGWHHWLKGHEFE